MRGATRVLVDRGTCIAITLGLGVTLFAAAACAPIESDRPPTSTEVGNPSLPAAGSGAGKGGGAGNGSGDSSGNPAGGSDAGTVDGGFGLGGSSGGAFDDGGLASSTSSSSSSSSSGALGDGG